MAIDFDAIPRIQAVAPVVVSPPRTLRAHWSLRHAVAALVTGAIALAAYAGAVVPAPSGLGPWLALGAAAVLAGLVLATYVPGKGGGPVVAGSPCGRLSVVFPLLALVPLSQGAPVLAVFLLGFGLFQRVFGAANCAV